MSIEDFQVSLGKEREKARADLAKAHGTEREGLEEKIAELTRRYADPEAAFAQFQSIITDLEAQLARRGNEIGGDRANLAKAALEVGDFTLAKALFEEIAARAQPEVIASAEASFALGQIAETEIRWHDAAAHYTQAARLNSTFDTLRKASRFAERSGDYTTAATHSAALVALATADGNDTRLSHALNEHALNLKALGDISQAETLYRQALAIDAKTIGTAHPDYAVHLNNLAGVVRALGRYPEAETLYRQALTVLRDRLGDAHPSTRQAAKNLLGLLNTHNPTAPDIPALRALLAPPP